jgi:hypothetical protein
MWYYNHQRSQDEESNTNTTTLRIPTTKTKVLPAHQMYIKLFYEEKIKGEVIRQWALEKEDEDGDELEVIPVDFVNKIATGMLAHERKEVQELVEARRVAELQPVEAEPDEEERIKKLTEYAKYVLLSASN